MTWTAGATSGISARSTPPTNLRRGAAFTAVGAMGIAVQLATLAMLTRGLGLHYLPATALAVETAVLHNFAWHERWTWGERTDSYGRWSRLWTFQLANGVISIGGNVLLMRLLSGMAHMNHLAADIMSIALCSGLNFLAGDRWVFKQDGRVAATSHA